MLDSFFQLESVREMGATPFWFVPEILERPIQWAAMRETRLCICRLQPGLVLSAVAPDFKAGTWNTIDTLQQKLAALQQPATMTLQPLSLPD